MFPARLVLGVLVLSWTAAAAQSPPPGMIADAVAEAKRAGKTEVAIPVFSEPVEMAPFAELIKGKSVIVATVDRRPPAPVATADSILTWRVVNVVERLTDAEPSTFWICRVPLPEGWPSLAPSQLAVPAFGGTMIFDGVTVTVSERESELPALIALQKYILIGSPCPNGALLVEYEFPISGSGEVLSRRGRPLNPPLMLEQVRSPTR